MTGSDPVAGVEDAIWVQIQSVERRLINELGSRVPEETIRDVVRQELGRLSDAPVRQYIPLLVAHAARDQLRRGPPAAVRRVG